MDTDHQSSSELDFAVFAWFFALAVLFQLARGDMGLFAALRNTPGGFSYGDGRVPEFWFCCALLTLVFADSVFSLVLLASADVFDFWWRLPVVTPSIYFQALIAAQILFTWMVLLAYKRKLRIGPGEFIENLRKPVLALLCGLFFFAAFHKLTSTAQAQSANFFRLIASYYAPFLPVNRVPRILLWLSTVIGELAIPATLCFRRSRFVGIVLCIGFACFVGSTVYGFGAAVLAAVIALIVPPLFFEPLQRIASGPLFRADSTHAKWRLLLAIVITAIFFLDHTRGFTLADRPGLFAPGSRLTTRDVLTLMQVFWFLLSTAIFACAIVSALKHRSAIVANLKPTKLAYVLPFYLIMSELGLYAGVKDFPSFVMFSGVSVKSCQPNHYIARDYLLRPVLHRDLLLVTDQRGNKIAIPALSLREKWLWSERHGAGDPLIDVYRRGAVTRLRGGVEQPFDIESLKDIRPDTVLETVLPRRLFYLEPALVSDLRCSMPELFSSPRQSQ